MSLHLQITNAYKFTLTAQFAVSPIVIMLVFIGCLQFAIADVLAQQRRVAQRARPQSNQQTQEARAPLPTAEVDTAQLPPSYVGHNIGSAFLALYNRRQFFTKSQFETTAAYQSRIEEMINGIRMDAQRTAHDRLTFVVPNVKVSYDADNGFLNLALETESVLYPDIFMNGDWNREIGQYVSTVVVNSDRTLGSAIGQNAFGVRRKFKITTYTTLRLAFPSERISPWSGGIKIPTAPDEARLMFSQVRLALTGNLSAPYIAKDTSVDNATITDPEEAHYFDYFLFFEPDTLVAYNIHTGQIYATLNLTNLPSDNWRNGSTIVAETRREREQRIAEMSREYPSEHVFMPTQVSKKAVVTYRPIPSYDETARKNGISGTVKLRVVLKANGEVGNITVLEGLPMGLNEKAVEAAKQIKFTPAERNGHPVSQYISVEYNFSLY